MSAAAPGDFFTRRTAMQSQMKKLRHFSDVDSNSDFEIEEDEPLRRPSPGSLSFKTEATEKVTAEADPHAKSGASRNFEVTSDGSILFESGSEGQPSPELAPVQRPAAAAPQPPPVQLPAAVAAAPQTLSEKLFGNIGPFKKATEAPPQPPQPKAVEAVAAPPPQGHATVPVLAVTEARAKRRTMPKAEAVTPVPPPVQSAPAPEPEAATAAPPRQRQHTSSLTGGMQVDVHGGRGSEGGLAKQQIYRHEEEEEEEEVEEDRHSDGGFVERVLPLHSRTAAGASDTPAVSRPPPPQAAQYGATPLRNGSGAAPRDPSEELLVRARLRLEEKRRNDAASAIHSRTAASTPHRRPASAQPPNFYLSPPPAVADNTATPVYAYRGAAVGAGAGAHAGTAAAGLLDAKLRRLTHENTRLQDEVHFLNRENQKLRAVAGSSDSAENIKMQLTIDMLRKELQAKELDHQTALRDADADRASRERHAAELEDQNEGYAATAVQYRKLYEDKTREVEQLKLQAQRLVQDVNALEHRQQNELQQRQGEAVSEREKVDKLLYLLEDVKKQRQHMHELNQQYQLEVLTVNDEKARLKEGLEAAEERARQAAMLHDQATQTLQQDVTRLKTALADKERSFVAQLREEQRMSANLQQRLDEAAADSRQEADRLRRAVDAAREDHRRALAEEKSQRAAVEERLRRVEVEAKASVAAAKEAVSVEQEKRLRRLREELGQERAAREAAETDGGRLAEEAHRLRDSLAYSTQQYQQLSTDFVHSEEARDRVEQQCAELTGTLQDMMQQDEQQTRRIAQLQATAEVLRQQLDGTGDLYSDLGSGAAAGGGAHSLPAQLQLLSNENERLTNECVRLAGERDTLIDENGKIAEELLKWKNEMRQFVSTQLRQPHPHGSSPSLPSSPRN